MTAPTRRPRRPGGRESPTLARLTAAREQLDAEIVERRGREDALLTEYAAATDAVTAAEARRDAALAELERQAAQLREAAGQELATLEARQGAVLVALHGDRTTEELAQRWSAFRCGGYGPCCAPTATRTTPTTPPPTPPPRRPRRSTGPRPRRHHRPQLHPPPARDPGPSAPDRRQIRQQNRRPHGRWMVNTRSSTGA